MVVMPHLLVYIAVNASKQKDQQLVLVQHKKFSVWLRRLHWMIVTGN